jgi:predicted AAA+ superfamily ATPase
MINRIIDKKIISRLEAGKVIIITAARRTGKTVLIKEILKSPDGPFLLLK